MTFDLILICSLAANIALLAVAWRRALAKKRDAGVLAQKVEQLKQRRKTMEAFDRECTERRSQARPEARAGGAK